MTLQGGSAPAPPASGIFVGRDRELRALHAALDHARNGHGRILLLVGEPGIGKTRLAQEFVAAAADAGADILWAGCWEGEGAPAFWPWVQIVRSYIRQQQPDAIAAVLGMGGADIGQIVPEVRPYLHQEPEALQLDGEQARFRLYDAVTTLLTNAATRRPTVVVLDDLHAADPPSLSLLRFLARGVWTSRLLVLGTYRDAEVRNDPTLSNLLADVVRAGERLALPGLTPTDLATYIQDAVPSGADEGAPDTGPLAAAVHAVTEGNPFFTTEIVRLLATSAGPPRTWLKALQHLQLPDEVRSTVRRRVAGLSDDTIRLLTRAAVIGREFDVPVLERLAAEPTAAVLNGLREACAAGVTIPVPESALRFSFSHALIRETLYDDLSPADRAEWHRHVAEVLEALSPDPPDRYLSALASHFFAGIPGSGVDKAIDYSVRAAERAMQLLGFEEAAQHYAHALQALGSRPDADDARKAELLLALADAQWRSGQPTIASETFLEAACAARQVRAAGAREHAGALLGRAVLGFGGGELLGADMQITGALNQQLVSLLQEALDTMESNDSILRCRLLARLASALYYSGSAEERRTLASDAVNMAHRIGDPLTLTWVQHHQFFATWSPGNAPERLAQATSLAHQAEALGHRPMVLMFRGLRINPLLELGNVAAADAEIEAVSQLTERWRIPIGRWHVLVKRVQRAQQDGRFDDAERLSQEAFALGQHFEGEMARLVFFGHMVILRIQQGRFEEIEPFLLQAVERYPEVAGFRCALAVAHIERGRAADAQSELDRCAAAGFATIPPDYCWLLSMAFLCQVCAALGHTGHAAVLYPLLRPYDERFIVVGGAGVYGAVARYLGLLAVTLARWDDAVEHFETALALNARTGARAFLALTQYDYANAILAAPVDDRRDIEKPPGRAARAAELFRQSLDGAHRLGMPGLEAKLERVAASFAPPSDASATAPVPSGGAANLFRKEVDHWRIEYEGVAIRLRDRKGLRYLAHLLRHPGREFHVSDLVASVDVRQPKARNEARPGIGDRYTNDRPQRETSASVGLHSQIADLRSALEEAERWNDSTRAAHIRVEIEALSATVLYHYRRVNPEVEKHRKAVAGCIRDVLDHVRRTHVALWNHLYNSIRTGTVCAYRPERPIDWSLE